MQRLLAQAQSSRAPMQRLADSASAIFVPTVLALAATTFSIWCIAGNTGGHHEGISRALSIAIAVLIIACPCAMGLAVPAAITVSLGRAAQSGLLIKGGEALERLATIDTLALDKTGTLTEGAPRIAAFLLAPGTTLDRATLLAHPERPVTLDEQRLLQSAITRRLAFEPIQHITGQQEFYGFSLRVTPAVLIPRPETELLVEAVLKHFDHSVPHASRSDEWDPASRPLRIVDVGTGSGAIAIALAHHLPQAEITAIDLSRRALAIARENVERHRLQRRVHLAVSDLLGAVANQQPFDAIVSNPPYIPAADRSTLHPQVRDHEPGRALFAGPTGLEIYERLIPQALALLRPGGLLALEIGYGQSMEIAALLAPWQQVEFLPDLQQIPRVALARRP